MAKITNRQDGTANGSLAHRRGFLIALLLLLLLFAANHAEYRHRQRQVQTAAARGALVVRTETSLSGHNQIGIDESSPTPGGGPQRLTFAVLGQWAFDRQTTSACPDAIRALSGRESSCTGFMYPLEAGTKLREFCLLRTTQTCCYGPRPQYSQYLLVEMKTPVKFERFAPVTVTGRFFVDPQPDQGFIYRMEGASVTSAAEDEPEATAAQAAQRTGLPLFDFAALLDLQKGGAAAAIPPALQAMDGKVVVMEGFVLDRRGAPVPRLVLGKDWWDGKTQGMPPTVYTAVTVFPRDQKDIPPAWKQRGVFVGTLRVARDAAARASDGIVSLHDAVRAETGMGRNGIAVDPGPFLPVTAEALILVAVLVVGFRSMTRAARIGRQPDPAKSGANE